MIRIAGVVLAELFAVVTAVLLATHDPLVLDLAPLTQQIHLEHGRVVTLTDPTELSEDDIPEILPASWAGPAEAVA